MQEPVDLVLTCGSWQKAQQIVDALLAERLIARAEFIPVKSGASRQGCQGEMSEVKLIMLSTKAYVQQIKQTLRRLHIQNTHSESYTDRPPVSSGQGLAPRVVTN